MDEEQAKMLVLDIQMHFPGPFEEILNVCGYANLIRALYNPKTRLAAINMLKLTPNVVEGDVLVDIANDRTDEATRKIASEAIMTRTKEQEETERLKETPQE